MTQRAETLFENEIDNFIKKMNQAFYKPVLLDKIQIRTLNAFNLIINLKKLIKDKFDLLKQLENQTKNTYTFKIAAEEIYYQFQEIIVNYYEDKVRIFKIKNAKENYENIMIFFISLFQKFEII